MLHAGRLGACVTVWWNPRRVRWLFWGLLAGVFLLVNIYRLSTAVLFEELMVALGTTGAQLGTVHAMFFYIYAVFQIPAGIMADRFGPRRTVALGGLVMNVGVIGFALSSSYPAALGTRFLVGLGGSVVFISILRFCANWYRPDEFGTMNGLSFAVSGFGGILATTPLALLVGTAGWRTSLVGLATVGLLLAGIVMLGVRDSPAKFGGGTIAGVEPRSIPYPSEIIHQIKQILTDPWTWTIGLLLFCTTGVNLTLFGLWGIPYIVQTYGVSVEYASMFTLLGSVGILLGPPMLGWLSDRTGSRTPIIVIGGLVYTVALAIPAVFVGVNQLVIAIVYFIVGWLLGAFVVTYPIIKERNPAEASGVAMGTVNGAGFLGAAVLPTVMGIALDAYWTGERVAGVRVYTATGYRIAFGIAAVCGVIALCCGLWLHRHSPTDAGGQVPESVK